MKRNHSGYSNLKSWKELESESHYSVVPDPHGSLFQLILTLPVAGVFYWLIHYVIDISDAAGLLMADCILIGTSILMVVIFLYKRHKTLKDMRPYLLLCSSSDELLFPRIDKIYHLQEEANTFYIAHDFFDEGGEHAYSELNLIEPMEGTDNCFPLLHQLGRCKAFDRIGAKLKSKGVPYQFRR